VRIRLLLLGILFAPGCAGLFTSTSNKLTPQADNLRVGRSEAVALPRELDKQLSPLYVVEPGDVLLLQPAEYDSPLRLPGDQPVLPDGTITLGKYGRIVVAGKTLEEVEATVKQQLASSGEKDPLAINARLVTRQSKVYYVLGEVNAPGAFILTGRETVLDALLQAGGVNDRAAQERIILTRPTRPCAPRIVLPICYREIVQLGDTSTNYQLQAGDRIFVPAKSSHESFGLRKPAPCSPCGKEQRPAYLPPERCDCPTGCGAAPVAGEVPVAISIPPAFSSPGKRPEPLPPPIPKEKTPGDTTSR
jgi:protein involved in polysaccharide export with SLBB domain